MNDEDLSPAVQQHLQMIGKELEQERIRRMSMENELSNSSGFSQRQDQNLADSQLNLKEELDEIFHLLSGHVLEINTEGGEDWKEPEDDRLKIFSPYGVKQIMNVIRFYVNKNVLMSYFSTEELINWKVRDFGIELSDLIFNRYEVFFSYPSPEELYDKYIDIVRQGKTTITEAELYSKCIQWSKEELQSKIRHFPMIVLSIVDIVHATYLRAFQGKERTSLRERITISQNANQSNYGINPQQPQKRGLLGLW